MQRRLKIARYGILVDALSALVVMPKQNDLDLFSINGKSIFGKVPSLTFL